MSKIDLLKQASNNTFEDLYIDNKPKAEVVIPKNIEVKPVEVKDSPKIDEVKPTESKWVSKNPTTKDLVKSMKPPKTMLAFRIPNTTIDNLEKYAYITRLTKQDVITMALDNLFNSKEGKEIIKEFDKIQK